ncbi:hypothetical protein BH20ACT18_BH20ACT18_06530 [soil metagenome]
MEAMTLARSPRIAALTLCAAAIATFAWSLGPGAAPAPANQSMLSLMQDDDLLVYRGNIEKISTLNRMKALGVDAVRVTVLWSVVAEGKKNNKRANDPRGYPARKWDRYDTLVYTARQAGVAVLFNVTGPGPTYGHERPPRNRAASKRTWKPKAREFAEFVEAVGKRYSGTYRDENVKLTIPRVNLWSIDNEPNQGGWLTPQFDVEPTLKQKIAISPILYRELYLRGRRALAKSGHDDDVILLGETAPLGDPKGRKTDRKAMSPVEFISEMMCIAPNGRPYKGRQATARKCDMFDKLGPIEATAFAHHPYTRSDAPTQPPSRSGYTLGNISQLGTALDSYAQKSGGDIPSGLPLLLTAYGYETNPPDPISGISPELQAQYINEGDFILYQNPRIIGNTQFLLRDVPPVRSAKKGSQAYWFTYQSGLFYQNDQPKPAALAYGLPLVLNVAGRDGAGGGTVNVWGQLRFRPNGAQGDTVQLFFRPEGSTQWTANGDPIPVTSPFGYFTAQRSAPASGTWRAVWSGSQAPTVFASREVKVQF